MRLFILCRDGQALCNLRAMFILSMYVLKKKQYILVMLAMAVIYMSDNIKPT